MFQYGLNKEKEKNDISCVRSQDLCVSTITKKCPWFQNLLMKRPNKRLAKIFHVEKSSSITLSQTIVLCCAAFYDISVENLHIYCCFFGNYRTIAIEDILAYSFKCLSPNSAP